MKENKDYTIISVEELIERFYKYADGQEVIVEYMLFSYRRTNSILNYIIEKEFDGEYTLTKDEFEYMDKFVWSTRNILKPQETETIIVRKELRQDMKDE